MSTPRLRRHLLGGLLSRRKGRPRACFHVAQNRPLPFILWMPVEEILGQKVGPARMAGAGAKTHLAGHAAVGGLALYGAAGVVCSPVPFLHSSRRGIDMTAK